MKWFEFIYQAFNDKSLMSYCLVAHSGNGSGSCTKQFIYLFAKKQWKFIVFFNNSKVVY